MKKTAPIWLFFLCCCLYFQDGYGQCNNPTVYWRDSDGDGFGDRSFLTQDITTATQIYNTTGSTGYSGNIAYGCNVSGYVTPVSQALDHDDSNPLITDRSPQTFYLDGDGDTFGNPSISVYQSYSPTNYVSNNNDCDDSNPNIHPNLVWYLDADGDGTGGTTTMQSCTQPTGYVATTGDTCDNDVTTLAEHTWYLDADGDGTGGTTTIQACSQPTNYVATTGDACDQDASTLIMPAWYLDGDGDGFGNAAVFVFQCTAPLNHVSNSLDRDDGNTCITDSTPVTYYEDYDGDGYGNLSVTQRCSSQPTGFVTNNTDCDDRNDHAFPGTVWYRDADRDGWGSNQTIQQCTQPSGYVDNHADYDDSTSNITNIAPQWFYKDTDGDGHGVSSDSVFYSHRPSGYVTNTTDCNDSDPLQHDFTIWYIDQDGDGKGYSPVLLGITNGLRATPNQNLPQAGVVTTTMGCLSNPGSFVLNSDDYDDSDPKITGISPQYFYKDADGDGYGNPLEALFQSSSTLNYVANMEDCDDSNALLHPQTVWYLDSDGDGWGSAAFIKQCTAPTGYVSNTLDYDDSTEHITNVAPQNYYEDSDGDGYGNPNSFLHYSYQPVGYVVDTTDCNDNDAAIHPLTVWYFDEDGDGFGTKSTAATATLQQCTQPANFAATNDDYDDRTIHIINIAPQNFYQDADGDGYGNPAVFLYYSIRPTGYVLNALDCNDADKYINPQKVWFQDIDGDGLGNPNNTTTSCTTPTGYVANNGDLSDSSQYITNIATRTFYYDADGDGFGDPNTTDGFSFAPPNYTIDDQDCNDQDNRIHPNTIWYQDSDGDGFGGTVRFVGCAPPTGYVLNSSDLDDSNRYITNIPGTYFYKDKDDDGYGDPNDSFFASAVPGTDYVLNRADCNDADASLHPLTQWYADGDDDGYGGAPDFVGCSAPGNQVRQADDYDDSTEHIINIPPTHFYQDSDTDGYGTPDQVLFYSLQPTGYVRNAEDCNDQDAELHPNTVWYADTDDDTYGDPEQRKLQCLEPIGYVRNPLDLDDGNGYITNISPQAFYRDADTDGFGTPLDVLVYSLLPPGYVVLGGDCDDSNPLLHPNTHWYADADEDGFGGDTLIQSCLAPTGFVSNTLDLDDTTEFITNKAPRTFYYDHDGDGFGAIDPLYSYSFAPPKFVVQGGDCNDLDKRVHPLTEWFFDGDGDGFGVDEVVIVQCEQPENFSVYGGDCNDYNTNQIPGATCDATGDDYTDPADDDTRNNNDTGIVYADRDRDGFGDPEEPYDIKEVEGLMFAWVNDRQDACPMEYGEIKGCPKPFVLETQFGGAHNQVVRLFEMDTLETTNENDMEALIAHTTAELAAVTFYPNPSDGLFYAEWDITIQGFIEQVEILSYPKWTQIEDFPYVQQPTIAEIDLTDYPKGIYFVQFHFIDSRTLTRKIIKQ